MADRVEDGYGGETGRAPPYHPRAAWSARRRRILLALGILILIASGVLLFEARTSWLQAHLISSWASEIDFRLEEGSNPDRVRMPAAGPYDIRLGYARLPEILERLEARGYEVTAQARTSPRFDRVLDLGLFPVYPARSRAGLRVTDRWDRPIYAALYPERVYPDFDTVPAPIRETLLYIENRTLLDPRFPRRNPAVEWERLAGSVADFAVRKARRGEGSVAGASTLATQIEKFRHSPGGLTRTPRDKALQMASATVRAYRDGPKTLEARRRIVLEYLNSVPLAAIPGYGEVIGLQEGLWWWFGIDPDSANARLSEPAAGEAGPAYRAALGLMIAQRRPSFYLVQERGREELRRLTDVFLDLLLRDKVIPPELHAAARAAEAPVRPRVREPARVPFVERKAANAVRTDLLVLLDVPRLYDLDRYDLSVRATIDAAAQEAVTEKLVRLRDPSFVREHGLDGFRLLGQGDPAGVLYSFVLYERVPGGHRIRVQTDNFDGPFDLNRAARLELGSTAKLRTLVTYLQIVERLHSELAPLSGAERREALEGLDDPLTRWAARFLETRPEASLREMLEAAMERSYSAAPAERFFTGGGRHVFQNFDRTHDRQSLTVRAAFRHSVNLVFIRLMRDIERWYMPRIPGSSARILQDPDDPQRRVYLERFADREGRQFVLRFYARHEGRSREEMLEALAAGRRLSPQRLAWAFRTVDPDAGPEELAAFLRRSSPGDRFSEGAAADLYERSYAEALSWADRGHLASIHPLELWVVRHLIARPGATRLEVLEASAEVRQQVYAWLFASRRRAAQDQRIRTMLEVEAFMEIARDWQALGYPFENLVPSYGTAIGSSGDRPAALAELVGIVLADGVRPPVVRLETLHFGAGTPYETIFSRLPAAEERALSPEVAAVARDALVDVVERGTARVVRDAFRTAGGERLRVGGKTGTGHNQFKVFGPGGRLVEARTVNRTATFVFTLGDRFFGVITAHVPGPAAEAYSFTSALPVRVLGLLAPDLVELANLAEPADLADLANLAEPAELADLAAGAEPADLADRAGVAGHDAPAFPPRSAGSWAPSD